MRNALAIGALLSVLCGCSRKEARTFTWPQEIEGGWQRLGADEVSTDAPALVQQLGLKSVRHARYQIGPPTLIAEVTAYEMSGSTGAFELNQKWRNEPDMLAFQADQWFIVLKATDTDPNVERKQGATARLRGLADSIEQLIRPK